MDGIGGLSGWLGTVIGTPDPPGLGRFYQALLGGDLDQGDPAFVTLHRSGTRTYLAFQLEEEHVPPAWPTTPGDQQMQLHLDVGVRSVPDAVRAAEGLGATQASYQPQDDVRVMLDPAGHPFCLYRDAG
ncbi:VOC family protein [Nocardioides coralli]|uniref:VOC family protein n=1 Tax=Nocardioides coralli TaxID=2872154 RepID=UPI0020181750|nr:VOC family protein [Nocardioides coralli]